MEKKTKIIKNSMLKDFWNRFRRNKAAVAGATVFSIIVLTCFVSPLFLDYNTDIIGVNSINRLQPPSLKYICGADELGRNVFYRILWGGRLSITMGISALGIAILVGIILGTIAAYYGKTIDMIIMRCIDCIMALPVLILMITLASAIEPSNLNLVLVIGIALTSQEVRLVRAQVLQVIDREYIDAIRIQGGSTFRIIVSHILPNALGPVISTATLDIAMAITTISVLSFMGLGVQPPDPEWGTMLSAGKHVLRQAWHVSTFPGVALVITVISLTLLGDGLRDALDPRMKR